MLRAAGLYQDALNFKPELSAQELLGCVLIAASACVAVYSVTGHGKFIISYAIFMLFLFSILSLVLYSMIVEQRYRRLQVDAPELGSPNSRFIDVQGAQIHARIEKSTIDNIKTVIHCLHGFGAHSYSFSFVQKKIAERIGAVVSAHDFPGFGLSARPRKRSFYTMQYNANVSGNIMDSLEQEYVGKNKAQRVLIGHSMGASAVAEALIAGTHKIDAVVLIAPAIVPLWTKPVSNIGMQQKKFSSLFAAFLDSLLETEDPVMKLWGNESRNKRSAMSLGYKLGIAVRGGISLVQGVLLLFLRACFVVVMPLLRVCMHALIFPRAFWTHGLSLAWGDPSKITVEYVDNYRLPVLARDWEIGVLRFVDCRLAEKVGIAAAVMQFLHPERILLQAERLRDACLAAGCNIPILIIHGANDNLVPLVNSQRLEQCLPACRLITFPSCGHMPHEEMPDEFTMVVNDFLKEINSPKGCP